MLFLKSNQKFLGRNFRVEENEPKPYIVGWKPEVIQLLMRIVMNMLSFRRNYYEQNIPNIGFFQRG